MYVGGHVAPRVYVCGCTDQGAAIITLINLISTHIANLWIFTCKRPQKRECISLAPDVLLRGDMHSEQLKVVHHDGHGQIIRGTAIELLELERMVLDGDLQTVGHWQWLVCSASALRRSVEFDSYYSYFPLITAFAIVLWI